MSRRILTGMNSLQLLAAAVAMGASVLSEATGQPLRNASNPRRRYQPPRDTQQQREIAEHNAAIDAQRAAKKAANKGKR